MTTPDKNSLRFVRFNLRKEQGGEQCKYGKELGPEQSLEGRHVQRNSARKCLNFVLLEKSGQIGKI